MPQQDNDERRGGWGGWLGRHRGAVRVGGIGVAALAVVAFLMLHTARQTPVHQPPTITMVMIQPPKPPPPPPPPPPQQKMITPPKMTVPTARPITPQPPKAAPPKAAAPAAIPMGTSIHNNGPADAFNLSGTPGGTGFGGGGGGGGGGSYNDSVSYEIAQALQKNPKTRSLSAGLQVRLWVGGDGTVTRIELAKSSGSSAIDNVIVTEALPHLHLDAPPSGTAMPMLVSLVGQAPL